MSGQLLLRVGGAFRPAVTFATQSDPWTIVSVSANGDDGNVAGNTIDDDSATRWSHDADPSILIADLGESRLVGGVRVWHWASTTGDPAVFDIETSPDNTAWTKQLVGKSDGTIDGYQEYLFPEVSCRYVRYVGHGRVGSQWNSITEFRVLPDIAAAKPAVPTLAATPGDTQVELMASETAPSAVAATWEFFGGPSGGTLVSLGAASSSSTLTDSPLTNGEARDYYVRATNADGTADSAVKTVTPSAEGSLGEEVAHGNELDDTNTGLQGAGVTYASLTGSTVTATTHNGQVVEYMDFTGFDSGRKKVFEILHDDVVMRFCRVRHPGQRDGIGVSGARATIEWCEVDGEWSDHTGNFDNTGITFREAATGGTVRRVRIKNTRDNIHVYNDNVTVVEYYGTSLHNSGAHVDGVHTSNSNNLSVLRSRMQTGPSGACIGNYDWRGLVTNPEYRDNFLEWGYSNTGGFPYGLGLNGSAVTSGGIFTGNLFKDPPWQFGSGDGALNNFCTNSNFPTWSANYRADSNMQATGSPVNRYPG